MPRAVINTTRPHLSSQQTQMAPSKNTISYAYPLCFIFILSTTTLSVAISTSYSSRCSSPSPASDYHTDYVDTLALLRSFQISIGYFSSGGNSLFSADDDYVNPRSFSFVPHGVFRTKDPTIIHLTATLVLSGPRSSTYIGHRHHRYSITQTISFILDGYYSFTSNDLCMVGFGTNYAADGSIKLHEDSVLRLRVPRPSKLTNPLVTGHLEGTNFETISLVAYDESDNYVYSENALCPPFMLENSMLEQAQAVKENFNCDQLKTHLRRLYKLEYMVDDSLAPRGYNIWSHATRMYINHVH